MAVRLGTVSQVQAKLADAEPLLAGKSAAAKAERVVELAESVEAPVEAGQKLGTVTVRAGETVLAEIPLVAEEAVARLTWWDTARLILRRACLG